MHVLAFALAVVLAGLVGCGPKSDRPDLGSVSGTVTLNGVPLSNAVVVFKTEGVRMCRGFTDSGGKYELKYLRDIQGAALGVHKVYINSVPTNESGRAKVRLPRKYNLKTELTARVEPGYNTFDWELKSDL